MKKRSLYVILAAAVLGGMISESSGAIEVYTFKKERVDQELKGNRGYVMGTPPEVGNRGSRKRTLIGVDVELPGTAKEEVQAETVKPEPVLVEETVTPPPVEESPQVEVVEEVEIEDEWIK
ncbi:MAG TPA: hypothetical protein PKZ41_02415 [Candidatus Omnitrophota bacterium]|nr:hypothetical protein [Candidatus Omnitrophota bacterium]